MTFLNSLGPLPPAAAASKRALTLVDQTEVLEFSIALTMRRFAELQNRIASGEKISPTEMEGTYLPLAHDYDAVVQWLSAEGFTITQTDDSRLIVFASGTIANIQQALQVEMARVTVEGKDYSAAQTFPSLPEEIAAPVLGINGLQPYLHKRKHTQFAPQTGNRAPYLISEILKAYNGQSLGVTGANQKVAILIDTFPSNNDLTTFWTNNGIAQSLSNIEKVQVVSGSLPAVSGEETLDVEWSSGIAPGAKVRVYASRTLNDVDLDKCFQRIINDLPTQPQMHQLSISLGLGETYSSQGQFDTDAQFLATLAANGVSVFVSSGDDGSTPIDTGGNNGPLQVEYYASDPSVTAVGGTSITLNASTGAVTSETAWSGSGGGASIIFNRPAWQVGTGVPAGTKRLIPDVALAADPNTGAYVYLQGSAQQIGGTSWSAPTWAGFCALINEARSNASKPALGLLNPSIYPLIGTSSFRDITSGNNSGGAQSGGKYTTNAGFDEVTGIGVPNIANLLQALVSQTTPTPTISSFTPTSGVVNASVTITGTNFTSISSVAFNGTSASYSVVSSTQISALVPSGATNGPISVTNPGGTAVSSSNFTVTAGAPAPSISGFTPTNGTVGDSIVISGANFTFVSAVTFNGAAASFTVNSSTQSLPLCRRPLAPVKLQSRQQLAQLPVRSNSSLTHHLARQWLLVRFMAVVETPARLIRMISSSYSILGLPRLMSAHGQSSMRVLKVLLG